MSLSVDEMQNRISAMIDVSGTSVDDESDDWTLRLKYLNMAQHEAFELYDWKFLYKEFGTQTSTSTGNVSISMPQDFRTLASFPEIFYESGSVEEFAEVRPQERKSKLSSDRFVYMLGNPSDGYTMVVHSGNADGQLPSGASIRVPYYSSGGSLASGSDVSMIPDSNYLVMRAVALLWEAYEDDRFPQAKTEAEKILQRLLERENVFSEAANDASQVRTIEQRRYSFRLGRD